jgi:thymidylate kinase
VPIRDCTVIAVEGTHASGKTTLVHALVSHYRERGVHVTCTEEPARTSPFMEDIVLRGLGTFDLAAELDAFAAMLTVQLRAARHHAVLIADKTTLNVVAYAEPHKCARVQWWPLRQLPAHTYPYTAEGIKAYLRGDYFSNVGWRT